MLVTYQTNGGNDIPQTQIHSNSPQWNPTIPQKEGYLFVHYCVDEALTLPYSPEDLLNNKQLILYARWLDPNDQTVVIVSFVTSGGTYLSSQLISKGDWVVLPPNPTMGTFTFTHWTYYNPDTGLDVTFDPSKPIMEHITLYANYR